MPEASKDKAWWRSEPATVRFETAAFEEINRSWTSAGSLTGFSASKTTSNTWTVEVPEVMARAIDIRVAGTITGTGARITARDDIAMTAGGDIRFDALQLHYFKETKGWSVGLSYPGSSLVQALQ